MCAWLEKLILILLSVDTTERCQQIQWDPYQNSNGIFFFLRNGINTMSILVWALMEISPKTRIRIQVVYLGGETKKCPGRSSE